MENTPKTYGVQGRRMAITADVNPVADAFGKYPLNTEEWMNMPEAMVKALNEEQLKLLSAAYEGSVQAATIATQDVIDYVTKLLGKATVCMSGLNLDNLNAACAKYAEVYPKKVVEQKPEIKV